MNKTQKINYIKYWLQRFGQRDNKTMSIENIKCGDKHCDISIQYNYDEDGDELNPFDWCSDGNDTKLIGRNPISYKTEEELDEIINSLKELCE